MNELIKILGVGSLAFIYKKNSISKKIITKKNKIIGFQILGIGNGHLTQSIEIYKVLVKYYKIPVVLIYGIADGYNVHFSKSKVI